MSKMLRPRAEETTPVYEPSLDSYGSSKGPKIQFLELMTSCSQHDMIEYLRLLWAPALMCMYIYTHTYKHMQSQAKVGLRPHLLIA